MYFANPFGLFALLSLPTIVVIHLYHRRLPPVLVAGLHLWGGEIKQPTSGRKRERLPLSKSIFLELLAALVLSLVLSQPRFGELDNVEHVIAVLDGSASMSAIGTDGVSFRDRAIAELDRRMAAAPRGSVVTVITTGRRPELLAGPAIRWQDAKHKLDDWRPSAPQHDFATALDMATQVAETTGQVVFLTDALPAENSRIGDDVDVVAVGQSLGNVAIIAARWSHDPVTLQGKVFVRLANKGARAVSSKLTGKSGEALLFSNTLDLPANSERAVELDVAGGAGEIVVTAETANDALAIDNSVTLIEPKLRPIAYANLLSKDDAAHRAVQRVLAQVPDVKAVEPDSAQLIFESFGGLPPSRRDLWWVGFGPLDRQAEAKKTAKDLLGPFLIDKRQALSDGVSLSGVVWAGVQPLTLDVTPIISAGDQLLLAQLNGTATTALVLNIDIGKSNLTETPDWPILISNMIEQRRDQLPGLRRWNYRLNEDIAFRLFEGREETTAAERPLNLVIGDRVKTLTRTPIIELPALDQTGVYVVQDGQTEFGRFAVNFFDPEESSLLTLRSGRREPITPSGGDGYEIDSTLTWLLMAGIVSIILLSLANWRELGARRAVA